MKRIIPILVAMLIALPVTAAFSTDPLTDKAEEQAFIENESESITKADIQLITDRVEEIRAMSKKDLSNDVRTELKRELFRYKDMLQNYDPVIYIGGGTLILIVILLILLL